MIFNQEDFDLRCEWGMAGIQQLAPISDGVIIVDVLSFSTCVEIATNRGAIVFPYRWRDETAQDYARSLNADLANRDRRSGYSLSPPSLHQIPSGTRLVLPSPNGAALSLQTGPIPTLVGCWRNCTAIAQFAQQLGRKIAVIPAGERWQDGTLRPAWEDWVGAGAILSQLPGEPSPEASAAIAAFQSCCDSLEKQLQLCASGKELIARGFVEDVIMAGEWNVSQCLPLLVKGGYENQQRRA